MDKYVAYVGTYTNEDKRGLHILDVDVDKGFMSERDVFIAENPSHLVASKDQRFLYATSDLGVISFRILDDGGLEELNKKWIGGIRGCFLSTDRANKYLFVAGYYDGRVTVMHLNDDGSVGEVADAVYHKGIGKTVGRRNIAPHVNCVMLTPDEKYLCAVDNGLDCVKIYEFDHGTGKIDLVNILHLPLDSAPRHMMFSRDGKYAYIIDEMNSMVEVCEYRDTEEGPYLERQQSIPSSDPEENEPSAGSELIMTPGQDYLICSNAGIDTVTIFKRNDKDGRLTFMGDGMVGGNYPKSLGMFPDGKHFVSLNYDSNELSFFHFANGHECFLECAKPLPINNPNSMAIVKID